MMLSSAVPFAFTIPRGAAILSLFWLSAAAPFGAGVPDADAEFLAVRPSARQNPPRGLENATHADGAAAVGLVSEGKKQQQGEKEQPQQQHDGRRDHEEHKETHRQEEQQERSEERQREESRRREERQREEAHRQREEEDRQRRREEEEERRYRSRGWCGPDECFSREGAHCFQEHTVSHCTHMIMLCAKNMIAGCQYNNTKLLLAAVPAEFMLSEKDPLLESSGHSFSSRLLRGTAAIMLVFVATFVVVNSMADGSQSALDAGGHSKKVRVDAIDGRPLLQ